VCEEWKKYEAEYSEFVAKQNKEKRRILISKDHEEKLLECNKRRKGE